ncbi:MAG: mechanosensitive ion channel family protein, partial [Pseudomonadota bacterium]
KTIPGQQWGVGRRYNELLKKTCDARGIEIPFPHMTIWMGENKDGTAPPVHLRAEGGQAPTQPPGPATPQQSLASDPRHRPTNAPQFDDES